MDALLERRADAEESLRVTRSPLADSYPCPVCHGDGYVSDCLGDVETDRGCDECHGDGAMEGAGVAAAIDQFLVEAELSVMTPTERRLRELLITTADGRYLWHERDAAPMSSPVVDLSPSAIDRFVEDMATEARASASEREADGQYAFAFGTLAAMTKHLLRAVAAGRESLPQLIRGAERIAPHAIDGDGGAAG